MGFSPRFLLTFPLLALAGRAGAQSMGIGTSVPHGSAQLEVSSTTRGLLLPRLSQAQLDAMGAPAVGLLVYNTTSNQLALWNGSGWQNLLGGAPASPPAAQTYTGAGTSTYTVPANTYALDVTLTGATGGIGGVSGPFVQRGEGGGGGVASARVYVQPGQPLDVVVGGQGTSYFSTSGGGYNGGGPQGYTGAGGGGATDLRWPGSGYAGRLLVAGGGGGASGGYSINSGANGGYPAGGNGTDSFSGTNLMGGQGATQTAGGAGGGVLNTQGFGGTTTPGNAGGFGVGAAGVSHGAGGGGGYFGGGGGSSYQNNTAQYWGGGSGGGGSSYAGMGTALASFQSNYSTTTPTDGRAVIQPVAPVAAPVLDARNFTNLALPWRRSGSMLYQAWMPERVGIGTTAPATPLEVVGSSRFAGGNLELQNDNASAFVLFHDPGNQAFSLGMDRNANNNFKISGDVTPANGFAYFTIKRANACVGIGTAEPVAPLHVLPKRNIGQNSFAWYNRTYEIFFGVWRADFGFATDAPNDVSIKADGRFVGHEFNSLSDRRLKNVLGPSDRAADLGLLRRLRITDYQMRDQAQYGSRQFKKVIAQEVEEVFPQAVSQHAGFLPDIYQPATRTDALPGDSLLRLTLPAAPAGALRAGQRLRLLGNGGEQTATVVQAAGAVLTLRGTCKLAGQPVFVFGREHADVRTVDYEALSMLTISATQELDEQLRILRARQAQVLLSTGQAHQAAQQARQQARQASASTAAALAALQAVEQELAAAEARLGLEADATR